VATRFDEAKAATDARFRRITLPHRYDHLGRQGVEADGTIAGSPQVRRPKCRDRGTDEVAEGAMTRMFRRWPGQ
jgi:hypothetical protein